MIELLEVILDMGGGFLVPMIFSDCLPSIYDLDGWYRISQNNRILP